ncbi:MAG: hypothetical protein JW723_04385 [Bacteroidales bacterium]|nr:hypothetical protein [Bacteroidales bacterium]
MKLLTTFMAAAVLIQSAFTQDPVVLQVNSGQTDFLKAYKAVLAVSDDGFHEQSSSTLFKEYGEHSSYWITGGTSKGSFVLPAGLPSSFAGLTVTAAPGYDWKSVSHRAVHFNRQAGRIAVFCSNVKVSDYTVTWETMYFRQLFETFLYSDILLTLNEDDLNDKGISDSVRILIIPSFAFNGEDGAYYIDQVAAQAPFLKSRLDEFLNKGSTIYAEGNAVYLLEKLGYLASSSVDFGNSVNSGTESLIDIALDDDTSPLAFNSADAGNKLYSGTVPMVNAGGIHMIARAAADDRPVIFEMALPGGGQIICNLGLPTAGGFAEGTGKRQLQWTLNMLMYAMSDRVDVSRSLENVLPPQIVAGKNAVSFDRKDTFDVRIAVRNLTGSVIENITVTENISDYYQFAGVVTSPGTTSLDDHALTIYGISVQPFSEVGIIYRLASPDPDDPVHEQVDGYLVNNKYLPASVSVVSYPSPETTTGKFSMYRCYTEPLFSARIFADTDVNWKNFLGLEYQPFKVFMIMENKQRTPAENVVYTQYIPKDVPFYWSDRSLNIPILKTPGGKYIDVLRGSNLESAPEFDMDSDGKPDAWLDTSSIYPKGYTITEEEVYWANPWTHLSAGFDEIVYEDIDHDGTRAQDTDGDGTIDIEEPGDEIRVWKVTWNIGEVKGYQYFDPYCSYELWIDPPDLVKMAAGVGYACDSVPGPIPGMFYPYSPDVESPDLADTSWTHWMERDENGEVIWKQFIYQRIGNYEGYTFIDTAATGYHLLPTDSCAGTVPQPHNEFIAVVSLGGEEIDMYNPVPSQSMYSDICYETIFEEDRITPIRTTYTYYAPLPNPLQFEYLSNNFLIQDTLGNKLDYLPSHDKALLTFDIDATTEYSYYWIRNVGYDVDFNDPSEAIDGIDPYGDGVFGYFIYDIPKGMGGYSITLPRYSDGSYNLDSIVEIDGMPFSRWIDNPNTANAIEIWEDPFEYHVYIPQLLIPPSLDDDNSDDTDDWIDDRGDRFSSSTGFLHDAFMPGDGEEYPDEPAVPFQDDIYGMVKSGWSDGTDNTYGDDFFEKPGKTHIRIHASYEGRGREGSLDISKGGVLVVEEIFGGSPWVIFSHVLSANSIGDDISVSSEVIPSSVKYGNDTVYLRHVITDENEPHRFDSRYDPYHLSHGFGEASVTTFAGGKDPCSLILPNPDMTTLIDPDYDHITITLIPDPDPSIPGLSAYPKTISGTFLEVKIEVMNGTDDRWINTTLTPVISPELGNTSVAMSYVAYPRPLVPGDDIGTFGAGWRFNQPEGEVLIKHGNVLPLLQPSRRAYFIFLLSLDESLSRGIYKMDFDMQTSRVYYTGEDHGTYSCDVPEAQFSIVDKDENGAVSGLVNFVIGQSQLESLSIQGTTGLSFTGEVKWSAEEIIPDDFESITSILPATNEGGAEIIDLSRFSDFPHPDSVFLYLLERVAVNSYNAGEQMRIVNNELLGYQSAFGEDLEFLGGPLYVFPVGPRITLSNRIYKVNGYRIEDTLMFEPDQDVYILTRLTVTNTGNDISSNTVVTVYPGDFYEIMEDSLPAGATVYNNAILVSLGAVVPGESKPVYLPFRLHDINEKSGLMNLIASSDVAYEGTSITASYSYSDEEKVMLSIPDFQLYAAVSEIDGNTARIEVTAVNRGIPAKKIFLRVYPVVGQGIAELPLAEMEIDSFATDQEVILHADYILPNAEITRFVAIIDDGDDLREVFELNNSLEFEGGQGISTLEDNMDHTGLLTAYPNPFRDHLVIRYILDETANEVQFRIFGMNGCEINRITSVPHSEGVHAVE